MLPPRRCGGLTHPRLSVSQAVGVERCLDPARIGGRTTPARYREAMRAVASMLLLLACTACVLGTSMEGKSCDDEHPCVNGYRCADGQCVTGEGEGEPGPLPADCQGTSFSDRYVVCTTPRTRDGAAAACAQGGLSLAAPRSYDETRTLATAQASLAVEAGWLSPTDRAQEGVFRYDDGALVEEPLWGPDQPDNWGGGEDCVQLEDFDQWHDLSCNDTRAALCDDGAERPGTCLTPRALAVGGQAGTTTGTLNVAGDGACFPTGEVWMLVPAVDGTLNVELDSATDQALSVREAACVGQPFEIRCVDDENAGVLERVVVDAHAGVPLFVIVHPFGAGDAGPYNLNSSLDPPTCGDGAVNSGEGCDDGNDIDADGCTGCARDVVLAEDEPNDSGPPWEEVDNFLATLADGPLVLTRTQSFATGRIDPAGDEDAFLVENGMATAVDVLFEVFVGGLGHCTAAPAVPLWSTTDADLRLFADDAGHTELDYSDGEGAGWCPSLARTLAPGERVYAVVSGYDDNRTVPPYELVVTVR